MSKQSCLEEAEIRRALTALPDWSFQENRLQRSYRFEDFTQAWTFMTGGALQAQALGHHPDWSNVYSRVEITLWTHDAGGVTSLDVQLARMFETLARKLLRPEPPESED
jgi:4a-hydroxytetrahydrobiopterin dehydratase